MKYKIITIPIQNAGENRQWYCELNEDNHTILSANIVSSSPEDKITELAPEAFGSMFLAMSEAVSHAEVTLA